MAADVGRGNGDARSRRTPAELRGDLERTRALLSASMDDLRREVVVRTDWRRVVRARPLTVLAGAFVLGFLLARR